MLILLVVLLVIVFVAPLASVARALVFLVSVFRLLLAHVVPVVHLDHVLV